MFKFVMPVISLLVGAIIGSILTVNASLGIAKYLSIAILAAMDSVLGGARSLLENTYDGLIMLSGFITNALLAMALAFLGNQIGIDMFMAATICFALRIFSNLAFIRRDLITQYREKKARQKINRVEIVRRSKNAPAQPNLENTISGLLLDSIPNDQPARDTETVDIDIDQSPVKVKAIISNKTEKSEQTENSAKAAEKEV
ncbi:MAG: DUF1290 domain-containing protein [Firmicutes bacterium]|nr:DUF1290 domain-containing protein [Bacillota bacterium]MBQ3199887.1 DUF1290 domain-containing protein [Bacillota bacterium]